MEPRPNRRGNFEQRPQLFDAKGLQWSHVLTDVETQKKMKGE